MMHGAAAGGGLLIFNGTFSASGASTPVTSATRTISGTGTLRFDSIGGDILLPQYSKNAGAWTAITDGLTLAMTSGDTLAVRGTGLVTPGWVTTFDLKNNATSVLIEAVTMTRT
jgi:hypothetical protein